MIKIIIRSLCPAVLLLVVSCGITAAASTGSPARKPCWRLIYNNDATNILVANSPHNPSLGKQLDTSTDFGSIGVFSEEMLRMSVREAAKPGVDAMSFTPGLCWVPWWPSKVYPIQEHVAWFEKRYGIKAQTPFIDYLLAGGDFIAPFIDECHKNGVAALVSYRLNDAHWVENADTADDPKYSHTVTRFYDEHPELRLGYDEMLKAAADGLPKQKLGGRQRVHDWSKAEARQYKFSLISEICEQYAIDGLELDFMRFPSYFKEGFPLPERRRIMVEFVSQVRQLLDRTQRDGKHRWLGVRIPIKQEELAALGVDPAAFAAAGVDYFNLSVYFETSQQSSIAEIRRTVPDVPLYGELTHTAQSWPLVSNYDGQGFRRSTNEMLATTARLFYERGVDGLSLFNFVYYREFGNEKILRGPFNEPQFDLLPKLTDRGWLDNQPQLYFLAAKDRLFAHAGEKQTYRLDMAPANGAAKPGIFRMQVLQPAERALGEGQAPKGGSAPNIGDWKVVINGRKLKALNTPQPVYLFPTEIRAGFGRPTQYLAFEIPAGTVKDGSNMVAIQSQSNEPWRLRWLEAVLEPAR
jgi:hypothetical protein